MLHFIEPLDLAAFSSNGYLRYYVVLRSYRSHKSLIKYFAMSDRIARKHKLRSCSICSIKRRRFSLIPQQSNSLLIVKTREISVVIIRVDHYSPIGTASLVTKLIRPLGQKRAVLMLPSCCDDMIVSRTNHKAQSSAYSGVAMLQRFRQQM